MNAPPRAAFRVVVDVVVDFNAISEEEVRRRIEKYEPGWDSRVLVRQIQAIDPPADVPPAEDYGVECHYCGHQSLRSASSPWCPSSEVSTLYTCKSCRDNCEWTEERPQCRSKKCTIHSTEARNAAFLREKRR